MCSSDLPLSVGYTPFAFDITQALKKGDNEVVVRVWDPTDKGCQPRGKQVSNPGHIWYTPVSGIWQTVWLEPVPEYAIENIRTTPDIDGGKLTIVTFAENACVHGIEKKTAPGWIFITVYRENEEMCIEVEDTGEGMTEKEFDSMRRKMKNASIELLEMKKA